MSTRVYNAVENKADLYARIPGDGECELLMCETTLGDLPFSLWQYDASSSASDNFSAGVIQPTLQTGNGRWLRRGYYKTPSEAGVIPSLNSAVQISTVRGCQVIYSVSISVTSTLIGTNAGTVFFEISPDNVNWSLRSQVGLSISGVVSTVNNTQNICGYVPPGYYYRLRTTTSGANGATFSVVTGQEILL